MLLIITLRINNTHCSYISINLKQSNCKFSNICNKSIGVIDCGNSSSNDLFCFNNSTAAFTSLAFKQVIRGFAFISLRSVVWLPNLSLLGSLL